MRTVMSNSFGFGGAYAHWPQPDASLAFAKI